MTPSALPEGEFQYYASPILVKNNRFYATLTNLRLIIEGSNSRDFKVASIRGAFPENVGGKEPGLKISISTPTGHKDMIWSFPIDEKFKVAEQQAWIDAITKAIGDKPFATGPVQPVAESSLKFNDENPIGSAGDPRPADQVPAGTAIAVAPVQPEVQEPPKEPEQPPTPIEFIRGETVAITTAGVRVKHTFYTAYLTNLRLILQNKLGKIGREFAIAELVDAAAIESESGEPEIAISIGVQGGLKQMIIIYPTVSSRDGWMQQLQNKLARKSVPQQPSAAVAARIGTFVPATNERVLITTPNVHVKNRPVVVHLTNTRFVVDSATGVMGDFAVSTIRRFSRMASEIGEPGISLTVGDREMHLVFANMNDRESWMDALMKIAPAEPAPAVSPYTVTTVMPKQPVNSQTMSCPNCGANNPVSEERCGMCGSLLHQAKSAVSSEEDESEWPPKNYKPKKSERREREPRGEWSGRRYNKERKEYTGGVIGFISRPRDAFNYYAHESPSGPFPIFLVTGAIWALLTSIVIVYILPKVLALDTTQFPIFAALDGNFLLLIIVAVILWFIWVIAQLLQATITSIIAHLFEPSVRISEVVAITMRSSLTYAVIGWIPVFGLFIAAIWAAIETMIGLKTTQDTSTAGSFIATAVGVIGVYVLLFFIGGGFS
ncbi:MAG TPA: Yip1 family protein [Methanocorpusculum sp.]|nr:Yip1 family protein [Methanocorpusculum sp.]